MALPTKNLPFEYTQRWTEVGPLLVPSATAAALNLLNKRDKDLEDYLAGLGGGGGGGCCSDIYFAGAQTSDDITSGNSGNIEFGDSYFGGINPVGGTPLSAGVWSISGNLEIVSSGGASFNGWLETFWEPPSGPSATAGGMVTGSVYLTTAMASSNTQVRFSGIIVDDSSFTPTITLNNNTAQTVTSMSGYYYAQKICSCDYTINF